MKTEKRLTLRKRRHQRVRKKVCGTAERPRMSVRFTERHVYVQFVDDTHGVTLAATSSRSKAVDDGGELKANVASAERLGKVAAEAAKAKGIERVVFDRGGARYHGKVKALADAAREAGLQF
mgnify:FL=1